MNFLETLYNSEKIPIEVMTGNRDLELKRAMGARGGVCVARWNYSRACDSDFSGKNVCKGEEVQTKV